jgi:hypothetical protein
VGGPAITSDHLFNLSDCHSKSGDQAATLLSRRCKMSAEDRESEVFMEAGKAAEYAMRSSLRTDSRSLREARVSSGIAASAYLKFSSWRGEASQQSRSEEGSRSQPTEAKVRGYWC